VARIHGSWDRSTKLTERMSPATAKSSSFDLNQHSWKIRDIDR
jgi:hypothetical protein